MADDYEFPVAGKTYVSPSLRDFRDKDVKVRIVTKLIESPDEYIYAKEKKEVVLRHKDNAASKISAKLVEHPRGVFLVSIHKYTVNTGVPHGLGFSFIGNEIKKLYEFLEDVMSLEIKHPGKFEVTDDEFSKSRVSSAQIRDIYANNKDLFTEVLKSEITTEDVVALGYRKKQLEVFKRLLSDSDYFAELKAKKSLRKDEGLWQLFFEKNQWIFGYGLSYIYANGFDENKLEKVVRGFNVVERGKRVDALMKTKGIISSLCFVEIKTHNTALLRSSSYRPDCWPASDELSGGVSQIQVTVESAVDTLKRKITPVDKDGNPASEEIYNYRPRAFLVIGSNEEFVTENGVNESKLKSFELIRRNTLSPEIITFDELYERARFVVENETS